MERVALCLASGKTLAEACRQCKSGRTAVWTWMRQDAFKDRVAELRKQLTDVALGQLTGLLTDAAAGLGDLLKSSNTTARLKLDAIRTIFETHIGLTNNAELRAEIEKLKALFPGGK
jgi:hypothetical protein